MSFLVDTAADRTALSADIVARLQLPDAGSRQLAGVGGLVPAVEMDTQIQLPHDGGYAVFNGRFAAFTTLEALDMSVLGRDITNLFGVIVDRPRDLVCLLTGRHRYVIEVV